MPKGCCIRSIKTILCSKRYCIKIQIAVMHSKQTEKTSMQQSKVLKKGRLSFLRKMKTKSNQEELQARSVLIHIIIIIQSATELIGIWTLYTTPSQRALVICEHTDLRDINYKLMRILKPGKKRNKHWRCSEKWMRRKLRFSCR